MKASNIKKIDYGINMWNPAFKLMKHYTTEDETPPDVIVENQFEGSAWKQIKVISRYYFTPIEINIAKMIYQELINLNMSALSRAEQNDKIWTMDVNEFIEKADFHYDTQNQRTVIKKQIEKTIVKLFHFKMELTTKKELGKEVKHLTSFIEYAKITKEEQGKWTISFKISEWFDVERDIDIKEQRRITKEFLCYQNIQTDFFNDIRKEEDKHKQFLLTHFKTLFDFKNGKKKPFTFDIKDDKDMEYLIPEWQFQEEFKLMTDEDFKRAKKKQEAKRTAFKKAFINLSKDEKWKNYFRQVNSKGTQFEIHRY
jgi:hypothetical protein